jgi:hypothetical protein
VLHSLVVRRILGCAIWEEAYVRRAIAILVLTLAGLVVGMSPVSVASPAGSATTSSCNTAPCNFRSVSPTGTDTNNNCISTPCATIQHAIDEAENGDWISVSPGTYDEEVTINKSLLTLSGPNGGARLGEPQAVVDGGIGTAIMPEANRITIRGMTVTAAATGTAIRTSGANVNKLEIDEDIISGGSSGVRLEAGGEEDTIGYDLIEGVGDGIRLSGGAYSNLAIKWNEFSAPIAEYAVLADVGTTIKGLRLEGNELPAATRIVGRVEESHEEENEVDENSFESTSGPQLAIDGEDVRIMRNSFEGHGAAGCLQILGSQGGLVPSVKILVSLKNEFIDCVPYGIELGPEVNRVSIFGNEFPGSYDGIEVSDASPWDVTGRVLAQGNRIVGTTHLGIDNQALGTFNAEQNWWGCNAGPGGEGCDAASAGVDTTDNVMLVGLIGPRKEETGILELPTANSITLKPGEEAEVAAALIANGSGINLGVPTEGIEVGFSSSLGTLSWAASGLSNGWTRDFFKAGSTPGQGSIVLSMDNQRTAVPVTIPGNGTGKGVAEQANIQKAALADQITAPRRKLRLSGRRVVLGLISCPTSCRVVTGKALVVGGGHRYRGTVTPRGQLGDESTAPIRAILPKPALRMLKKVGTAQLRVKVTVTNTVGQIIRRRISVKLIW